MHSWEYTKSGGTFEAIQLWVNLPARLKMTPPKYQTLTMGQIPEVPLADGAGVVRVIAGDYAGAKGPAETFTPIDLWDVRLKAGRGALLTIKPGQNASVFVLKGKVRINGGTQVEDAQLSLLTAKAKPRASMPIAMRLC
jgi:redox-sensitive bicupin YhaK (pirin superfamily)